MSGEDSSPTVGSTPNESVERERIYQALTRTSDAPLREGNRLTLLKDGPDTYDDWLGAIHAAERWIHVDNYIFEADATGLRFSEALCHKAAGGIKVRVLYDWFGCLGVPRSFWSTMRESGVEVRAVNPPTLGSPFGVTRRDHRKMLAVDGNYASTGGVCISDGWLVKSPETGLSYRDTAVSVRGPAVADVEHAFAEVWNEYGRALPARENIDASLIEPAGDSNVRVVVQEPRRLRMLRMLELLTSAVRRRLWITDAYFLSVPILTQSLMAAARDGVDVRVLLPSTNDLPWVGTLSRTGYRQFLEAGLRIFEYGGPMIHAKTVVADGWWSKVGSTNLNLISLAANWEMDLVAEDSTFARQMEDLFDEDLASAREIRLLSTARRQKIRPERPLDTRDRRTKRGTARSGTGSSATAVRVGSAALRKTTTPLETHEQAFAAAASATLLGSSLLAARFPRLIAWPLSAVGIFFGITGLIRVLRQKITPNHNEPPRELSKTDPL